MANPASMLNVLNGTETTQSLLLGAGCTLGGRPLPGGGANIVSVTAGATTLTCTAVLHANKMIVLNNTGPITITLPAATGTGDKYEFIVNSAATGTASVINTVGGSEYMAGMSFLNSTTVKMFATTSTSAVVQLNGGSQGGVVGDKVVLVDIATSLWQVMVYGTTNTTPATNFAHI